MNSPVEQREKKIKAAEKARNLLHGLGKTRNLEARATLLHDRVSEGIKTICDDGSCFTEQQTETLTAMSVHLALLFDGDMQPPNGFVGRLLSDYSKMGAASKVTFLSGAVALVIGLATLSGWGISALQSTPAEAGAESSVVDAQGDENNPTQEESVGQYKAL